MSLVKTVLLLAVLVIQILKCTQCYKARYFKSRSKQVSDVRVELTGAVADITTRSKMQCLSECFNKCLSFFYNENTGRCVMHSRDLTLKGSNITESGWKFYSTEDVSGRCPPPNYFYRRLDFCYNLNTIESIDSDDIKTSCTNKGGKVATITSLAFQEYFVHILNERPYERVFLAGTVQTDDMVRLDNGTLLTYYNWYPGKPSENEANEACLELYMDNQWFDVLCNWPHPAMYLCEF